MRLLIVNSRFLPMIGGGETYILELMLYFSSLGWDVHLLTNNNGYKDKKWKNCTIHSINGFDDTNLAFHTAAPQFREVLDDVKPDIIHVHNIMPFFLYSSITSQGEFPTVVTIHNTPKLPERLFGGFGNLRTESIFCKQLFNTGRYDALIFGSQYYLDSYAQEVPEIQNDKTHVVHFFPPSQTVGPFVPKQPAGSKIRILFPSRVIQRKGVEECIRALALLPSNFVLDIPAFSYHETSGYNHSIYSLIENLDLKDRVLLPTSLTTPDMMAEHYKKANIVVIPSHYEGFGIVAVEAMTWGVPIVTTGVGGLGEIFNDQSCILVQPHDPDSLAAGIERLSNDDTLYINIAENGIDTVRSRFGYDKHMQRIKTIYQGAYAATS